MSVYIGIKTILARHLGSDEGASIVEYALLISLIALVALVAVAAFGTSLSTEYSDIANQIP
jgi:pilus assembly protein Flp/PilA